MAFQNSEYGDDSIKKAQNVSLIICSVVSKAHKVNYVLFKKGFENFMKNHFDYWIWDEVDD